MTTTSTLTDLSRWLTEQLIDRMEVGYEVDQQFCWELQNCGIEDDDMLVFLEQLGAVTKAIDIALNDVFTRRLEAIERSCALAGVR